MLKAERFKIFFIFAMWSLAVGGLTGRLRPRCEAIAEVVGTRGWAQCGCGPNSGGRLYGRAAFLRQPGLDQHAFRDYRYLSQPISAQWRSGGDGPCGCDIGAGRFGAAWRRGAEGVWVSRLRFNFLWQLLVRRWSLFVFLGGACRLRRRVLLHAALPGSPWTWNVTAVCATPRTFMHPTCGHDSFHGRLSAHRKVSEYSGAFKSL